ncbi:hypothetical protein NX059_012198 [Plenodomus lindquistii]|nr:hypothetical protein NX059_012198 [Plenodomus lindquistii]
MICEAAQAKAHFLICRGYKHKWINGSPIIPINSTLKVSIINCDPSDEERATVKETEAILNTQEAENWSADVKKWKEGGSKGDKPKKPKAFKVPI